MSKTIPDCLSKRVAVKTFGCRSNYADSVDLQAALLEKGAIPSSLDSQTEVLVVNTCTVTDAADKDALKYIRQARKKYPDAQIVVTGCMAEVSEESLSALDDVSAVIGPGRKADLLAAVMGGSSEELPNEKTPLPPSQTRAKKNLPDHRSISLLEPISKEIAGPGTKMGELNTRARYHLRIQEGCENSCTFCIIPFSRGALSSRPQKDLLDDIKHLVEQGYEEVVLTGTHIGGYGEDLGGSLQSLLETLSTVSDKLRIRLSSIDPNDLSKEIIDLLAKSNIYCPHLHICVQAFTDRTLKRMNRRYRMEDVREIMWYIHSTWDQCCIGADLITGFPGESRQEVDQGIEEFLRLPISYLHVFPYSERSGTAAVRYSDSIPLLERKRRAARWRAVAERKRAESLSQLRGSQLELIVERISAGSNPGVDFIQGTSAEYAPVQVEFDRSKCSFDLENLRLGQRVLAYVNDFDTELGKLVGEFV